MAIFVVLYLALIGVIIASWWKIFEKAGQPGWAALVPFYNTYIIIVHVAGLEVIWFWLLLVPLLNIFVAIGVVIMLPFAIAQRFGKDALFGIGLLFLGFIFYPILAFGDAEHDSQTRRGRRRSRGRDYSDYDDDEDDRPRKKKRRDDDDEEEEEERPSKRRQVVDEDEEERPSKRRRVVDDDEDDRPAKKRRPADDDEDDRPRRRRRDDD